MKKYEEAAEADIPEDALIANPSRPLVRLRGSHSSQQEIRARSRRRPRDDDEPDDDDLHPPPPPPVSAPDLAIQILPCQPALEGDLISAVREAIGPNADVRTMCGGGTQRVGIWLRPFVNERDNLARNRGLQRLGFIAGRETLAFFVNASLIRRQALAGWNAAPKRLNSDGAPDPNGSIHLTGFSLNFESPNRVVTRIDGFDESPWPDVDFQLITTDTLSASGQVHCESETDLEADTTWLNFLSAIPLLGVVFAIQAIIASNADAPDVGAGAGCGAAALIPHEILIPFGLKVVASYFRLEVWSGGIVAGGLFATTDREPELTIAGPAQLAVREGLASVTRNYSLRMDDLRPPFQVRWSGDGVVTNPTATTTSFRFNLTGSRGGQVLTRRVAASVTDVDGLVAAGELIVRIHITPADDDGLPPICRIRPWLPQCQRNPRD